MVTHAARSQVLSFRVRAQHLERSAATLAETAILDAGVQDTGPDGALWALAVRGVDVVAQPASDLVLVWSIRGAPHLYRREDLAAVAVAVQPFSDEDAGKRIYDAAKPLRAAGISNLAALDAVSAAMRSIVVRPTVKGEVSGRLTQLLDPPYLRYCRPCQATHIYEMPFRLAALRAGLELQIGTSPPVLTRIPGFTQADRAPERLDVIRTYLRLLGPATPKHVADYLDAPVKAVQARWPADVAEVLVGGETRWMLEADKERLDADSVQTTRLLGPYDLFLQAKDRSLLVDDLARAKALWPVLGRPGAVLIDGEIAGTWRPRKAGARLTVSVHLWARATTTVRDAIMAQAHRLAAHRQCQLATVDFDG